MSAKKLLLAILGLLALTVLACGVIAVMVYGYLVPTRFSSSPAGPSPMAEVATSGPETGSNQAGAARATPSSSHPAAGICASFEGDTVAVEILPDIPSPRCALASPHQKLHVSNRTDVALTAILGAYKITIQPGETGTIEAGFGSYLLPGVHRLSTSSYAGPELWLQQD